MTESSFIRLIKDILLWNVFVGRKMKKSVIVVMIVVQEKEFVVSV